MLLPLVAGTCQQRVRHTWSMRTLLIALSCLVLSGCGGTQRRSSSRSGGAPIVAGIALLAGVFVVYGLIACAEEHGGACSIPLGEAENAPTPPGRDLGR